ncbi:hypothetical protein V5799_014029, partial [Amblyomma americanum]
MSTLRVRIHQGSSIIITSTFDFDTANQVRQIDSLKLAFEAYVAAAYVATPESVSKGVIHGLNPNTSETELVDGLRAPFSLRTQEDFRARMLGANRTAVLTFNTRNAPLSVICCGRELPCYPFKPTKQ